MPKLHMKAFGTRLWPTTLLCALLKLNYPLKTVILTNIICFYNCSMCFQNVLELQLQAYLFGFLKKIAFFYLKYILSLIGYLTTLPPVLRSQFWYVLFK